MPGTAYAATEVNAVSAKVIVDKKGFMKLHSSSVNSYSSALFKRPSRWHKKEQCEVDISRLMHNTAPNLASFSLRPMKLKGCQMAAF
jgi:hypothetical protein